MRVVELFAGVGGFRIGFEGPPGESTVGPLRVVWANQWEPTTKKQHAAEVYVERWGLERSDHDSDVYLSETGDLFVNKDIGTIPAEEIPDHDLLCGGFPCQDYSVAKSASTATGLEGKKGVLWWEIHRILEAKKPDYALLENVDRLLKSPTSQRGRDFAVMLASLDDLGYAVEWRSFSSSDYGFPQRRKRVYILAHAPGTDGHESLTAGDSPKDWIETSGVLAKAFPIKPLEAFFGLPNFGLRSNSADDLADITRGFKPGKGGLSRFQEAGVMVGGTVWTTKVESNHDGTMQNLGDILLKPSKIADEFVIRPSDMMKEKGWVYLKGAKSEPRKGTDGFTYDYKEGPITFPDALDRPSRTMVTGEGGSTPSRFKHVVEFKPTKGQVERLGLRSDEAMKARDHLGMGVTKWLRRLTPVELERLNGFPDDHTEGVTDAYRAFFMGNALVCGIVKKIGECLSPVLSPKSVIHRIIEAHNHGIRKMNEKLSEMADSRGIDNSDDVRVLTGLYQKMPKKKEFRDQFWEAIELGGPVIHPNLRYSGTQASNAFRQGWPAKNWQKSNHYKNAGRRYVGLLDFLILDFQLWPENGMMNHKDLLEKVLRNLNPDIVVEIYHGVDINSLNLSEKQKRISTLLMLAFVEQEINWGVNFFQKHTNFGSLEFMYMFPEHRCEYLDRAVPRDLFCSHILFLFNQLESNENFGEVFDVFLGKNLQKTSSIANPTIMPAIDKERIRKGYEPFMLSFNDDSVHKWIEPFIDSATSLCEIAGPHHNWSKNFTSNNEGEVKSKSKFPGEGADWPEMKLNDADRSNPRLL